VLPLFFLTGDVSKTLLTEKITEIIVKPSSLIKHGGSIYIYEDSFLWCDKRHAR
jgi:hypothetical protein